MDVRPLSGELETFLKGEKPPIYFGFGYRKGGSTTRWFLAKETASLSLKSTFGSRARRGATSGDPESLRPALLSTASAGAGIGRAQAALTTGEALASGGAESVRHEVARRAREVAAVVHRAGTSVAAERLLTLA